MSFDALSDRRAAIADVISLLHDYDAHLYEETQRVGEGRNAGVWRADYASVLVARIRSGLDTALQDAPKPATLPVGVRESWSQNYTPEAIAEVVTRFRGGESVHLIAARRGMSEMTVYRVLRRGGIEARKFKTGMKTVATHGRAVARDIQNRAIRMGR